MTLNGALWFEDIQLITEFLKDPNYSELGCLEIGKDIFEA